MLADNIFDESFAYFFILFLCLFVKKARILVFYWGPSIALSIWP